MINKQGLFLNNVYNKVYNNVYNIVYNKVYEFPTGGLWNNGFIIYGFFWISNDWFHGFNKERYQNLII